MEIYGLGHFVQAQHTQTFNAMTDDARTDGRHIPRVFPKLCKVFNFSLRTAEQCMTQLAVVVRSTPKDNYVDGPLLSVLLYLRAANKELYFAYCAGAATPEKVMKYLESQPDISVIIFEKMLVYIEAYLVCGLAGGEKRGALIKKYETDAKAPTGDEGVLSATSDWGV